MCKFNDFCSIFYNDKYLYFFYRQNETKNGGMKQEN